MFSRLVEYVKLIRIPDWLKNIFIFVPIVFAKQLFVKEKFFTVLAAFFVFSLASSIVYVINDIFDSSEDAAHPVKRNRPIAKGTIKKSSTFPFAVLLAIGVFLTSIQYNYLFVIIVWSYVAVNILYSAFLKKVVIVDILSIASGFIFRILAGAYAINVSVSGWLILTTIFVSLFPAVMKRRVEIVANADSPTQRSVLKKYSVPFLDQLAAMTGGGIIFSYALYSVSERTVNNFGTTNLVFTTSFVVFGVFRYMYLVYKKERGENAIQVLLTDLPMMVNLFLYVCSVVFIIYF